MHRSGILLVVLVIGLCFKSYSSVCVTRRRPTPPFLIDPDRSNREEYSRTPDSSNKQREKYSEDSLNYSESPRVVDDSGYTPAINLENPRVVDDSGYTPAITLENPRVVDDSEYTPAITSSQPETETPRTTKSTETTARPVTRETEVTQTTTIPETTTDSVRTTRRVSTVGCPNGFYRFGQYCYYLSPQSVYDSLEKSQSHCKNSNSRATLLDIGTYSSQDQDELKNFLASGLSVEYAFPLDVTFDNEASKYEWNSNRQKFDCDEPIKFQYCNTPLSDYPFVWVGGSFDIENTYIFNYTQIVCQLKV